MDQLLLNIKEPEKLTFIKELLSAFDYVELIEEKHNINDESFEDGLKESIEWVKKHKEGKITQHKTFEQLLNEL